MPTIRGTRREGIGTIRATPPGLYQDHPCDRFRCEGVSNGNVALSWTGGGRGLKNTKGTVMVASQANFMQPNKKSWSIPGVYVTKSIENLIYHFCWRCSDFSCDLLASFPFSVVDSIFSFFVLKRLVCCIRDRQNTKPVASGIWMLSNAEKCSKHPPCLWYLNAEKYSRHPPCPWSHFQSK